LVDTGHTLRLWNPATEQFLRAPAEAKALQAAQTEIARLQAELAQLKDET
jgi:hypothetical protein